MAVNTKSLSLVRTSQQYAYVLDDFGIANTSAISLSTWFKIADIDVDGVLLQWSTAAGGASIIQIGYEYNGGTRRLVFQRKRPAVVNHTAYYNVTLATNTWYHVVITWDGADVRGYLAISGGGHNQVATVASTGTGSGNNDHFSVGVSDQTEGGSWTPTTGNTWGGLMDCVRVFNTNVSIATMDSYYVTPVNSGETNLVTGYNFEGVYTAVAGGYTLTGANSPTFSSIVPFGGTVKTAKIVVVAGGGGGGDATGGLISGGGGAGGFLYNALYPITIGSYPVVVGGGGAISVNGSNSSFSSSTATGGGAGAPTSNGSAGGSGGGGGFANSSGGAGTAGQGNAGGGGANNGDGYGGGGGGGATLTGSAGSPSGGGNGGTGKATLITGSLVTYAGGGGGGGFKTPGGVPGGTGGTGGGGNGGAGTGGSASTAGGTNTGGGGGGGEGNTPRQASAGGSGTVIVAYLTADFTAGHTGGNSTGTDGDYTWVKFTSDGTFGLLRGVTVGPLPTSFNI